MSLFFDTAIQGTQLANVLATNGTYVHAKAGSPVDALVSAYLMTFNNTVDITKKTDNTAWCVYELTEGANDIATAKLDSLIMDIASHVKRHFSFAKNIATPTIKAMSLAVNASMQKLINEPTLFNVIVNDLPLPLQNEVLQNTIKNESRASTLYPEQEMSLPAISTERIYELIASQGGSFNEQIKEWIVSKGDVFFTDLWNDLFLNKKLETYNNWGKNFTAWVTVPNKGVDAALAIFLLSQRLEEEILDGTEMALPLYKSILSEYRQAAIEIMNTAVKLQKANDDAGVLVSSINTANLTIYVNASAYKRWIETGGQQEVLAGLAVSGNLGYTVGDIEAKTADYLFKWNSYQATQQAINRNNAFALFKSSLRSSFYAEMNRVYDQEKELFDSKGYIEQVNELFENELRFVNPQDMTDVEGICMLLLCRSRFYYTDVEKILVSMTKAAKEKADITPTEAALIACIEYVADYVADQLEIK